jgi:hypothetical protein
MTRASTILICIAVMLLQTSAFAARDSAKGKDGKDDVVGTIWSYTITHGKEKESGKFRVYDGKIYKGDKVVGKYQVTGDEKSTITFTDWPEMNGSVELTKTRRHPPRAKGTLKKDDGTEWEMHAEWKDG